MRTMPCRGRGLLAMTAGVTADDKRGDASELLEKQLAEAGGTGGQGGTGWAWTLSTTKENEKAVVKATENGTEHELVGELDALSQLAITISVGGKKEEDAGVKAVSANQPRAVEKLIKRAAEREKLLEALEKAQQMNPERVIGDVTGNGRGDRGGGRSSRCLLARRSPPLCHRRQWATVALTHAEKKVPALRQAGCPPRLRGLRIP